MCLSPFSALVIFSARTNTVELHKVLNWIIIFFAILIWNVVVAKSRLVFEDACDSFLNAKLFSSNFWVLLLSL